MANYFKGKNILVTGASYGLGAVIARKLLSMQSNLILVARNTEKIKKYIEGENKNSKCLILKCDLNSNKDISQMCEEAHKKFQKIDIIMHVAGGGLGIKDPLPLSKDYLKVIQLNLFSALEINRYFVPLMKKEGKGTLFHVGSIAANEAIGSLSYNIAKVGLVAYVRSLSKELSGAGIVVNGISPGAFESEGNAMSRLKEKNINAYKDFINKKIPLKKMSSASDFLPLIMLLVGESNHIYNGNVISCENGEGFFY